MFNKSALFLSLLFTISIIHAQDFRLLNGMTGSWVAAPGTGMVGAVAVVKTGVRNETPATNGLSHYLEHMLFNGTRTLTQEQLYALFDRFGIYANAQTGKNYIAFMMVGRAADLDTIMGLLREQLFYSSLPENKFGKEKGIVIEEMSKDELDEEYRFETLADLWDKSETPYARPTLGSKATIEAIDRQKVLDYYHTWFHPNNIRLLIAADAPYPTVEKSIRDKFEPVVAGDLPQPAIWKRIVPDRDLFEKVAVGEKESYRFRASFPVEPVDSIDAQAALEMAVDLYDTERLFDGTPLSDMRLSLFRDADFCQLELSGSYTGLITPDTLRAVLNRTQTIWKKNNLTASALRRTLMQARVEEGKASERLQYWGLLQAPKIAVASDVLWNRIDARKQNLTLKEIATSLERTWNRPFRLFAEMSPKASQRNTIDSVRIESTKLGNGVRITARQSPGSDLVGGQIAFAFRSAREPDSLHGIAEIAHNMLSSGPATLSVERWKDTLAAIGLDWKTADNPGIPYDDYYTNSAFSFIRFDVPGENLELAVKLIIETVLHPRLDSVSFQAIKTAAVARAGREFGAPRSVARNELDKRLYKSNPPVSPYGTPKSVSAIRLSDVMRFVQDYWNGNSAIVTLDGALPPDAMIKAISTPLQALPAGVSVTKPSRSYENLSGKVTTKAGKTQSFVLVAGVKQNPPKELADAASIAIDIFSTRMEQDLRETRGWAYSVGAGIRTAPEAWILTMQIGTKKKLIDSASVMMMSLYRSFRASTVDSTELIRAKNAIAGRQRMREAGRQYRAYALGNAVLDGEDPARVLPGFQSMEKVSSEDIRKVISNLPEEFIIIQVE